MGCYNLHQKHIIRTVTYESLDGRSV